MNNPQSHNISFDLFNIFGDKLLYNENIHSDIIAYFLGMRRDENENKQRFPKYEDFLQELLRKFAKIEDNIFNRLDFTNVEVEREADIGTGRIDILVKIPLSKESNNSNKLYFVVVIENKIISFEHGDQLKNYYNWAIKKYGEKSCFIFLSPKKIDPSNTNYKMITYTDVANVLKSLSTEDQNVNALITLYSLCLEQVSKHIPSKFQDYLAFLIKRLVSDEKYSNKVLENAGSYSNTWIDFEPKGWDDIIKKRWRGDLPTPKDGIWGFSFYLTQANGLTLEFYFLSDFDYFYDEIYPLAEELFQKPQRIGQGRNEWMSIYSRQILDANKLKILEESYSDNNHLISEIERDINDQWTACIKDFDRILSLIKSIP